MNLKQKKKMQKLKPKASDGRKHLNDVRVIQRNLVYIIGLPLNLANEDVSSLILSCIFPLLESSGAWPTLFAQALFILSNMITFYPFANISFLKFI